MAELELVLEAKAKLGEGPSWDAEAGRLYWVDIEGFKLHAYEPETGKDTVYEIGQHIGAVVPYEKDRVVIVLREGFHFYNLDTGELELIHDPENGRHDNRFNDGKCDPAGRFWAGTMSLEGKDKQGSLYCLEKDGEVRTVFTDVTTSNGLGWSPDHKTMYYIDTQTGKVDQYDFEVASGSVSNPRVAADFEHQDGFPDGMTVDAEGMIWVAHWGGSQVSRWNPNTGKLLSRIEVPAKQVTCCCFGGKDLDELYITTARTGLDEEQLANTPHAGGLFRVKPGVKGMPTFRYKQQ
ncbi:SMP-30/gluconolactonase/LRE family protein [Paenibacillus sp. Marseille-Q4541]|uniref:SMP-30/gluconolactonase/LRE family protein n=1 Tax=Paenibacillus sp. Marseille-Q4541 TaxID=2831522 RepID=UPI001BACF312|nr:SMP-30/gluconolactonase/LRE family protein [Paenibacillus sp. Marseille-Q4541]